MTVSPRLHRPARRLLLTASSLLLLGALSGCEKTPAPSFKSLDITGAEYARQLALTDANGQPFQLSSLKGKVAVVFFGYTQCPDVCPTTLTNLAETQRLLGPDGDKLVGVFVTVDPKRDTTALMKSYVGAFHPNWVGLRGSADGSPQRPRSSRSSTAKCRARPSPATRWTTRRRRSCSTRKARCACMCGTTRRRLSWRRISKFC